MKQLFTGIIFACAFTNVYSQHIDIEKAALEGSIDAQKYLSKAYANGSGGFRVNLANSIKFKEMAATQGDAESQYDLFFDYAEGNGVTQDFNIAKFWLDKACQQAYAPAATTFALLAYSTGKDYDFAFKSLNAAIALDPDNQFENTMLAKHSIAMCYLNGWGTEKNFLAAFKYFTEGYNNGSVLDGIELSRLYAYGNGIAKDFNKAMLIVNGLLKDNPNDSRLYDLKGEFYLNNNEYFKAREMWNKVLSLDSNAITSGTFLSVAFGENIDYYIPSSNISTNKTFALVIANENYKRVPNVPYAINDGMIFRKYLLSTFGVPEDNIEYLEDASLNDIKYALANITQRCNAFKDQISVIVYYAGHGVPNEKTAEAFLLPVDGFGTDPSSGLNLDDFYASLSAMPAKSVIVLLDACFSGAKRDGGMLMATRGITIKPKMQVPDGKLIVLSATSDDETAFPIEEQKHGLFTYALLRKIQETNGAITWGELADHVTETVKNRSIDLNGKVQTPTVAISSSMKDTWRGLKLR
ncbi:MAG: hypothetical protein HDS40_02920 [Bacteroides sp.]|nr:hypothetical protein [Bacteroides sp.]